MQPDLSRARELDVQIQSLVSQSKQVEEILQGTEKAANAQANKLQSVQGAPAYFLPFVEESDGRDRATGYGRDRAIS